MLLEHDASFTEAEYAATLFLHCPSTLQNELLAGIIAQKTGCRVRCGTQHLIADAIAAGHRRQLVLFDCHDMSADPILATAACYCPADHRMLLALFNADPDLAPVLEKQAMRRGIRGIFYENQSIDILVKGISAILSGEWWFSRKALGLFFDQIVAERHAGACLGKLLTHREKDILHLISAGDSNQEIAEKLHLSIHTVKTHIYNIFRKIKVPNRLQAALWVAQHPSAVLA